MTTEKKVLKKRGRKPKNTDKNQTEKQNNIQENLIIKLKKSFVDDYNVSSYDIDDSTNEKIEEKTTNCKLCWNCCHKFHNVVQSIPIKIVRPFNNYGPGLSINDGRVVPDFFSNVISPPGHRAVGAGIN